MGKEVGKIFEELGKGKEHDQNTFMKIFQSKNAFKEWPVMGWGGSSVARMYVQVPVSSTQHKLGMVIHR